MQKQATDQADLNKLWVEFVAARAVAQQSSLLEDGIRAGKSWAAFLELFVESPSVVPGAPR